MSNFKKLAPYIGLDSGAKRFFPVSENDILSSEKELGFSLPLGLKEFYERVGYGWIGTEDRDDIRNLVIHPLDVVDLYNGESEFSPINGFLDGDLPFFDCGGDRFLVVRPQSLSPEAIYRDKGEIHEIAANMADLIEQLLLDHAFYEST